MKTALRRPVVRLGAMLLTLVLALSACGGSEEAGGGGGSEGGGSGDGGGGTIKMGIIPSWTTA
jgi:hypothetical protein